MKNSKEYSRKVQKWYRSSKRRSPRVQRPVYDEPVDALVYAIVSEKVTDRQARSMMRKLAGYFVDFNELRVSRETEIIEVLGADTLVVRDITSAVTRALRAIFERYNTVSLEPLRKLGKRPAKQTLEKMDGVSHFAANYCMLTSLGGHAIPLTKKMIDYLRCNELIYSDADCQQIEGFLTRQISAKNAYEFYALLRHDSELRKKRQKKKRKNEARE